MKAAIITPFIDGKIKDICSIDTFSYIICADSAFIICKNEGINVDMIIGDFDHNKNLEKPKENNNIHVVSEIKDDTDTMLCLKKCIEEGYDDITIIGGIGGRCDHTFANIQTLVYALKNKVKCSILSSKNELYVYNKGIYNIIDSKKYFSIFSLSHKAIVSLSNCKYEGENITLTYDFPLGVSNEFIYGNSNLTVKSGLVLLIKSND